MNPLIEESLHRRTSATVLFPMQMQGEPPMLASSLPNYGNCKLCVSSILRM